MEKEPKVSVLMSSYNETYEVIRKSIASILNQSYRNIELILVDDNPENHSIIEVVDSFADSRIQIIRNGSNMGLVKSLNRGLEFVTGQYIARMDADDIAHKDRIQEQLTYLQKGNYDLIGCSIEFIDEAGSPLNRSEKYPSSEKVIRKRNRWRQCVAHPTFFLKKEVYEKLGGYRDIQYCEDYDFICRCIYSGFRIGNHPKALLSYRIRKDSITSSNQIEQKVRSCYIGSLQKKILSVSEEDLLNFFASPQYADEIRRCENYYLGKSKIKSRKTAEIIKGISLICNKYLVYAIMRNIYK